MPVFQADVVFGRVGEVALLGRRQGAHPARRPTVPKMAAFDDLPRADEASRAEHRPGLHLRAVQHQRPHTDQAVRLDRATMEHDHMADRDPLADDQGKAAGREFAVMRDGKTDRS